MEVTNRVGVVVVAEAAVCATGATLPATFVIVTAAKDSSSGSFAGWTLRSSGWESLLSPLVVLLYPRVNSMSRISEGMEEVCYLKPSCSIRIRRC